MNSTQTLGTAIDTAVVPSTATRIVAGLFALGLGAFFIFGVGFAHSQTLHDTAHDTRHGFGFPCH